MNWRFVLPFAIVAVAVLAVAGVATVNMGNQEIAAQPVAVVPLPTHTTPEGGVIKTQTVAVVSTGDPVSDIVGTLDIENTGDAAMMSSAAADASVVNNDNSDLTALSSSYDATTF